MAWRAVYPFRRVNGRAFLRKKKFAFEKFCYHKLVLVFVFAEGLAKMPCSHRTLQNILRFLVIFMDNWLVNLLVKKKLSLFYPFLVNCLTRKAQLPATVRERRSNRRKTARNQSYFNSEEFSIVHCLSFYNDCSSFRCQ